MVKDNDGYESLEKGGREASNMENKVKTNTKCDDEVMATGTYATW